VPPRLSKEERELWRKFAPDVFVDDDGVVYPFRNFIEEYYALRLKYKKEGNVLEVVLKLALNSLYGKSAQSVGGLRGIDDKFIAAPRTACPWIAGAITAGCRAMLIKAAIRAPRSIIMAATDALAATEQLHIESEGKPLGGWEMDIIDRAVFVKPGNYALAGKKGFKGKSRGVNTEAVLGVVEDAKRRNEQWFEYLDSRSKGGWTPGTEDHDAGVIEMPHTRFLTFSAATVSEASWQRAGSWIITSRQIRMNDAGCKRLPCRSAERAQRLVPTVAAKVPYPDELSRPHDTDWINPPDEDTLEFREAVEQEQVEFGCRGDVDA
jgi:DNA polymerase type B, organellar and viral